MALHRASGSLTRQSLLGSNQIKANQSKSERHMAIERTVYRCVCCLVCFRNQLTEPKSVLSNQQSPRYPASVQVRIAIATRQFSPYSPYSTVQF